MKLFMLLIASVLLLGCEAESDPNRAAEESACPTVGDLTVEKSTGLGTSGRCLINGTLTVDATLPASTDWYLNGALHVGDGASSPELTIVAGAEIFGSEDGASFDYLYVAPGASLDVSGTLNDPVIFSSDDADFSGSGEWGGIILEDTLATNGDISMQYVIVTEAGGQVTVGANTYADNIVLEGVHDDTEIQYLQSHDSARDGIRLQSSDSAANQAQLAWLLITGANRDGLSYDNFTGLVKDMLVIHRVGQYSDSSPSGGRAGIYVGDANDASAIPLLVNITLAGRDNSSISSLASDAREFGILFADGTTQARMANIVISNFRNGCYEVDSTSDLSAITFSAGVDLTASFIDGVHCGHEQANIAGNVFVRWLLRSGDSADNLPSDVDSRGDGNGNGFRFYDFAPFNFHGEANPSEAITSAWYLNSISGSPVLLNNLVDNSVNLLNAFADGDTNGVNGTSSADINVPLSDGTETLYGVGGATDPSAFDLTNIGASRSDSSSLASEFDGWTLQAGGVFPDTVTGFAP